MKNYFIFTVVIAGIVSCIYGMDDQVKAKTKVSMIVDVVNHITKEGLSDAFLNDLVVKIAKEELRDVVAIKQHIEDYKKNQLKKLEEEKQRLHIDGQHQWIMG